MTFAIQRDFAAALLAQRPSQPQGLMSWNSSFPARRFEVYRNNVVSSLIAALESRFPVTEKIVGEPFFKAMANEYITLHPPCSPVLLEFGNNFGEFVGGFEPAAGLPYLPGVIQLEIARASAYHAADLVPLDLQRWSELQSEGLAGLTFTFHPSVAVVRSVYPIVKIWAMNAGEVPLEPIEIWQGEDALVTRPALDVLVHALPRGGARFVGMLMMGAALEAAFRDAASATENFDLAENLACLLRMGAVTHVEETLERKDGQYNRDFRREGRCTSEVSSSRNRVASTYTR